MNEAVIPLDTNVVSELMRPKLAQAVLDGFATQDSTKLFFSAVSEAELRTNAILPAGKRRDNLTATIDIMITEDFAGRVLPFDSAAAKAYAAIAASRQPSRSRRRFADSLARVRGAAMATVRRIDTMIGDPFHDRRGRATSSSRDLSA